MGSDDVNLVVKSPNHRFDTQKITCKSYWKVADLKRHLSIEHAAKPAPETQRLIFAGKLLTDDLFLNKIFANKSDFPTIHLVCPPMKPDVPQGGEKLDSILSGISPTLLDQYKSEYYSYLQSVYAGQNCQSEAATHAFPVGLILPFSHYAGLFELNHLSSRPISNSTTNEPEEAQIIPPAINGRDDVLARANINEAAAPLGLFANLFRRFGVLVPGGGGDAAADGVMGGVAAAVAAEEDENNAGAAGIVDLLDLFYMFFRLGIVLAICAVYSSLEKTLVVIGVVLCVYIHNHLRERQMLRRQQEETERRRQDNQERQRLRPTSEASLSDSGPSASQDQLVTQPSHLEESNSQHSLNPETNVAEHIAVEVNADDAFQGPAAVDRLRAVAATSLQFVTTLITSIIPEPQAG